ncbi:cupredoxin domain-containing protein [Aquihabitans sp. McL0605]|uniref:cupredoxin domain-containing protein n=1 Tax=Aquihabitans sp. McL0605 TaxID=3415671 RepID=UPI003CF8DC47
MTRSRTLGAALALALTLAFVAAGCGSSGGSDSSGTTAPASGSAATGGAPVALSGKVTNKGTKDISSAGMKTNLTVEMDDNYFKPTFIKAAPGAKVTVELKNEGSNPHTFTLADSSIDQKVDPGSKATVTVTVPMSGSLDFHCDFHGTMGMQGAFYSGTAASSSSTTPSTTAASSGRGGY